MRIRTASLLAAALVFSGTSAYAACHPKTIGDAAPGSAKADLNSLKNRTAPPDDVREVRVPDILAYEDQDDAQLDQTGVMLTGVLLNYHHEGPESPNCHSATREDYHIWIGARGASTQKARNALRKESVVVELTPNIQDEHPDWAGRLQELRNREVCITGWLMFDPEHPDQVGKTRGTRWEVHPITAIGAIAADSTCQEWD